MTRFVQTVETFRRTCDGAITALNMFFLMVVLAFAGMAIDMASAISARTQLQATADAAAHAALVHREWNDADTAKELAVAVASVNMPSTDFGNMLKPEHIVFRDFDRVNGSFVADPNSRKAVLVKIERVSEEKNPVGPYLLQFVGFWNWDVRAVAPFETYYPTWLKEGFVADDVVDIQSNNSYFNGFCIHSNKYVTINNNNFFESGSIVSMPDSSDLEVNITGSGEDKNEGLEEAQREGKWFIKVLNRIQQIETGVLTEGHRYAQEFTTDIDMLHINDDLSHLKQGNKHVIELGNLNAGRV